MKILFVCTANICRSPVAEHYLRRLVERIGPNAVEIASTGTHAVSGLPSDGIAARLATEGIAVDEVRPIPPTLEDVFISLIGSEPAPAAGGVGLQ